MSEFIDPNNLKYLKHQISSLKQEKENLLKENNELKLTITLKNEKIKESLNKLEVNDLELMRSLQESKQLSLKNTSLIDENERLYNRNSQLEKENYSFQKNYNEYRQQMIEIDEQLNLKSKKKFENEQEIIYLKKELEKKENEIMSFFEFENEFKKKIDEFSTEIRAWIKILNRFFLKIEPETAIHLQNYDKILRILNENENLIRFKDERYRNIEYLIPTFTEGFSLVMNDFDNILKNYTRNNDELMNINCRMNNLEKECKFLNDEEIFLKNLEKEHKMEIENLNNLKLGLIKEKDTLRNDLINIRREKEIIEQETNNLKIELEKSKIMIEKFQINNERLTNELSKKLYKTEENNYSSLKERNINFNNKENNNLEKKYKRILEILPQSDYKYVVDEIIIIENDIKKNEEEKQILENQLSSLESNYKKQIKLENNENELFNLRRQIENYRENLNKIIIEINNLKEKSADKFESLKRLSFLNENKKNINSNKIENKSNYEKLKEKFTKEYENNYFSNKTTVPQENNNYIRVKNEINNSKNSNSFLYNKNFSSDTKSKSFRNKYEDYTNIASSNKKNEFSYYDTFKKMKNLSSEKKNEKKNITNLIDKNNYSTLQNNNSKPIHFFSSKEENEKILNMIEHDQKELEDSLLKNRLQIQKKLLNAREFYGNSLENSNKKNQI